MNPTRDAVAAYWSAANARDWAAFARLLADDVVYELPQTRERIRGRDTYLSFNVEYPGDWHAVIERIVADERHAASWIRMRVDGSEQPALSYFDLTDDHRIRAITEFWPEPYEPPAGREHLVERY
jgi:hypothetical protein